MSSDLSIISKVTNQIYLSGVNPLNDNPNELKKNNIKYILSCVDNPYVRRAHEKILMDNPDVTILYLPYSDITTQNLWKINKNEVSISKYINPNNFNKMSMQTNNPCTSTVTYYDPNNIESLIKIYQGRPMIEIGYHFIDQVLTKGENILVHCMAGISRSVSLVVYYLMKKFNRTFNDILKIVKNRRNIADPNYSFKVQLKTYDILRENFTEKSGNNIADKFIIAK